MPISIYILEGFPQYEFRNKKLFRKSYRTGKRGKWQYRVEREIIKSEKDGVEGFWLVKNRKRKFYPLNKLRYRLKNIK